YANIYAATPLGQYTFNPPAVPPPVPPPPNYQLNHPDVPGGTNTATDGYNVMLQPLDQQGSIPPPIAANMPLTSPSKPPATPPDATSFIGLTSPLATDYFYVIGNVGPGATAEIGTPAPGTNMNADAPPTAPGTGTPPVSTVNGTPGTYANELLLDGTTTPPTFSAAPPSI